MNAPLHYLLMANHQLFQKALLADIKETGLTPGQPKILDYLSTHDGAVQKEIAVFCHMEPATVTSVLLGMESKGLIVRKNLNGNRRSLYVFLTDTGRQFAETVRLRFEAIEARGLNGFSPAEKEQLSALLSKLYANMCEPGGSLNA